MPGYFKKWPCGPYSAERPVDKNPTMFVTVMHGLLVGQPTPAGPVVRGASELELVGIVQRDRNQSGAEGAHPGAQLLSMRMSPAFQ